MFYRHSNISEKLFFETTNVIQTMNDISINLTLATLPTKRCGLYSVTPQRTLGVDANGHLCFWYYDGKNDKCLNGSTVLSGTDVRVGAVHSRKGVRLYVNGVLDAFAESPLWSEEHGISYIGTHALAPNDLEMDGVITGSLLVDYAMTDEEMSVAKWDSELCVVNNHLFYAPSNSVLHVSDTVAPSLNDGSVYVLEDLGSLVLSNEEKLPCWYIGEYNSTTQDIPLNISDKKGGGTYNRMEVDHLIVHDIDVASTEHGVEEDGEDVYPYLAINEYNNAIFTNPHINTLSVEYHSTDTQVADPSAITVWGSSYDSDFPFVYAKYSISYKDGSSGVIYTTMKDPTHQQNMIRTVTCYVEVNTSTYSWPLNPTAFTSYTGVSFYDRNAHAGKYQFTRQWTWFGEAWTPSSHSSTPSSSIVGFTSGHWVSGSETATFVVDDDYLRNIVVVEDVVSQTVKNYATSKGQPVSSYMGKKSLPTELSGGYALKDSTGSLQAKDCYLDEIHADGFTTETFGWNGPSGWGWTESHISGWGWVEDFIRLDYNLTLNRDMSADVELRPLTGSDSYTYCLTNTIENTEMWGSTYTPSINYDGNGVVKCKSLLAVDGLNGYNVSDSVRLANLKYFLYDISLFPDSEKNKINSETSTGDKGAIGSIFLEFTGTNGNSYMLYSLLSGYSILYQNPRFTIEDYEGKRWASFPTVGLVTNNGGTYLYDKVLLGLSNSSLPRSNIELRLFSNSTDTSHSLSLVINNITMLPPSVNFNGQDRWTGVMVATSDTYKDEFGVSRSVYMPIYIQNWWDVSLNIFSENILMETKSALELLSINGVGSMVKMSASFNNFPYNMVVRTWNKRGRILSRCVLPYPSTDEGVKYYGATLGRGDAIWDSVYARNITDGKRLISRPYSGSLGSTSTTTFYFFDNYKMIIGRGIFDSCEFLFDTPFAYTSYTLLTNGTVTKKETGKVVITKPSGASEVSFIAVGQE